MTIQRTMTFLGILIILMSAALFNPVHAANPDFRRLFTNEGFLVDSIIQLTSGDIMGTGVEQVLLLGKNYEAKETFLYVISWEKERFRVLWKSPNLYSSPGHLAVAVGDFMGEGYQQVLMIGDVKSSLYRWKDKGLTSVWEGKSPWMVQELAALRHNGRDFLVLTKIDHKNSEFASESLNILKWTKAGFQEVVSSGPIGVIRAVATGTILKGNTDQIMIDVGQATKAGKIQVWRFTGTELGRLSSQSLSSAASFGLAIDSSRQKAIIADDRGKVGSYVWDGSELSPESAKASLGWALASATVGNIAGERLTVVVAEYPNTIHVLVQ